MDEIMGINDLIRRINALDAEIGSNEEALPLVHDMFNFIKDIIPLMLEFNAFMRDGSQKIPSASDNLHNVSRTTELATHEILDRLEFINHKIEQIKKELRQNNDTGKILEHIQMLEDKTAEIFLSFQFQDITTQQLEYVHRVLEAIYQKFVDLFNSSLKIRARTIFGQDILSAIEKELERGKNRRALQKFNSVTTDLVRQNNVSQSVIDKYFEQK